MQTTTTFVDCTSGDDNADGSSILAPLKSIGKALSHSSSSIDVRGGFCFLHEPLHITQLDTLTLSGDGKTAISSGRILSEFHKSNEARHKNKSVFVSKIPADVVPMVGEIKQLRVGSKVYTRGRWPKRHREDDYLTTKNFMFIMPWSNFTNPRTDGERSNIEIGINFDALPEGAQNLTDYRDWMSSYVHVYGCVEKDVNSQLTKILDVGIYNFTSSHHTVTVKFRTAPTVDQRFYFENVDWGELSSGEFIHDEHSNSVYINTGVHRDSDELVENGAVVPLLETLIHVQHSRNIQISNLSFLDTTFFADGYWDGPAQQPADSAVKINYSENVHVSNNMFLHSLGGCGVSIGNETSYSRVTNNLFDHVGESGIILYGFDSSPVPSHSGSVKGNNTMPHHIEIDHNVMSDIGLNLPHVGGVVVRGGHDIHIHHNRISHSPRYAIQVDSFFPGSSGRVPMSSRNNLIEFNIINDTCTATDDAGAIEMLGSGDMANDGPPGWDTNSIVRFNNISTTIGSSSSDGENVCVHGQPQEGDCRGLTWGIYLDGCQSGVTIFGNIIGASLHGSIFDNAGGNNSHMNNIFLGERETSTVLMDFGSPGLSPTERHVGKNVSGSIVKNNIFFSRNNFAKMLDCQAGAVADNLKQNGSDFNVYFSPTYDLSTTPVFPEGVNLTTWQGIDDGPNSGLVTCTNTPINHDASLRIYSECTTSWHYNETSERFGIRSIDGYALNLDCGGDYKNCEMGTTTSTKICLDLEGRFPPSHVDNQGWLFDTSAVKKSTTITAVASGKCIEVCLEGGDVGGCNGKEGSYLRLGDCKGDDEDAAFTQRFRYDPESGYITTTDANEKKVCVNVPEKAKHEPMDLHSVIADPMFADQEGGNFTLRENSVALKLGFQQIPPISAPTSTCGSDSGISCLKAFYSLTEESNGGGASNEKTVLLVIFLSTFSLVATMMWVKNYAKRRMNQGLLGEGSAPPIPYSNSIKDSLLDYADADVEADADNTD